LRDFFFLWLNGFLLRRPFPVTYLFSFAVKVSLAQFILSPSFLDCICLPCLPPFPRCSSTPASNELSFAFNQQRFFLSSISSGMVFNSGNFFYFFPPFWLRVIFSLFSAGLFLTSLKREEAPPVGPPDVKPLVFFRVRLTRGLDAFPILGDAPAFRNSSMAYVSHGFKPGSLLPRLLANIFFVSFGC